MSGSPMTLNVWQKRQATVLYHYTSQAYLQGLKDRLDVLIGDTEITLDTALRQGRDQYIANPRWGWRDTAANWSTYGFPALKEWRQSVIHQIARRAIEAYSSTGAENCSGMLRNLSMGWTTPEEEKQFQEAFSEVYGYATYIDSLIGPPKNMTASAFNSYWYGSRTDPSNPGIAHLFPRLPKYVVHIAVEAETGKKPPRTGVYVPQDDPLGALQFCWTGGETNGSPGKCVTFNDLGRKIIQAAGRDNLWVKGPELVNAVKQYAPSEYETFVRNLRGRNFSPSELDNPNMASRFLRNEGMALNSCKWYFVEQIEGEYDDAVEQEDVPARPPRTPGGQPCPESGWWFTPAKAGSRRYFKKGEVMPSFEGSAYGDTFWQWDARQGQ